eukprot:TRINITY_DN10734_c0_g1_i3.p1 TRINITY_DN10734_c0_g1~~TRINITY_DN10734_c0_g1_i3.p1  ORF type:complete len:138 (+),score=38.34 TRINITY_DN10734_c0_g1_i3:220-633(+)
MGVLVDTMKTCNRSVPHDHFICRCLGLIFSLLLDSPSHHETFLRLPGSLDVFADLLVKHRDNQLIWTRILNILRALCTQKHQALFVSSSKKLVQSVRFVAEHHSKPRAVPLAARSKTAPPRGVGLRVLAQIRNLLQA